MSVSLLVVVVVLLSVISTIPSSLVATSSNFEASASEMPPSTVPPLLDVGAEYRLIPMIPTMSNMNAAQVPQNECTGSWNMRIPQTKLTMTMVDAQVPTAAAMPALRMPMMPPVPPTTQRSPDSRPHGVNATSYPSIGMMGHSRIITNDLNDCSTRGCTSMSLVNLIGTPKEPCPSAPMAAASHPWMLELCDAEAAAADAEAMAAVPRMRMGSASSVTLLISISMTTYISVSTNDGGCESCDVGNHWFESIE
mmetsp:Transcript_28450/g.80084  ORF Transcript_28450/g.80084 Transcript_28450/m.80084 type:complete len:252 (+) Transcript_28450:3084-3839(+)